MCLRRKDARKSEKRTLTQLLTPTPHTSHTHTSRSLTHPLKSGEKSSSP